MILIFLRRQIFKVLPSPLTYWVLIFRSGVQNSSCNQSGNRYKSLTLSAARFSHDIIWCHHIISRSKLVSNSLQSGRSRLESLGKLFIKLPVLISMRGRCWALPEWFLSVVRVEDGLFKYACLYNTSSTFQNFSFPSDHYHA